MQGVELFGVGITVLVTVSLGMVAHECTHAAVLHSLGIPYDIDWVPSGETGGILAAGLFGTWATVTPQRIPRGVPTWGLQLSAIAPFALAAPLALVAVGILPDPLAANSPLVAAVTVAWLGCAIPSPQDFSLFWHAGEIADEQGNPTPER